MTKQTDPVCGMQIETSECLPPVRRIVPRNGLLDECERLILFGRKEENRARRGIGFLPLTLIAGSGFCEGVASAIKKPV